MLFVKCMVNIHSTSNKSHAVELSLAHVNFKVFSHSIIAMSTFSVKLDILEFTASIHVLHHMSETHVRNSFTVHDPKFKILEVFWESFCKNFQPLVLNLCAPSEVDVESS